MPSFLSHFTKAEQRELFVNLNYLNTSEIQSFCKKHKIPYVIAVETTDGVRRKTREHDRKGLMLKRVRHFLKSGVVLAETLFPARVIHQDTRKTFTADSKLYYRLYDKTNHKMITLLKNLTGGEFADGAIARILLREFWAAGEAPTFRQFATAWLKARKEHNRPNPEWAFLSDLAARSTVRSWKKLRTQKAKQALAILARIPSN